MKPKQLMALAAAVLAASVLTGCDAGDTNPVSPQKMEEIRTKTNNERANFKPPTDTPPPPANK